MTCGFPISGPTQNAPYDAESPVVVANAASQQFLTAFAGQEVIGDQRVFGQRIGYLTDDFGDAPEPFPTSLVDNGARHTVVTGLYLGAGADLDFDGQPSAAAVGDDEVGEDDEDGVTFDTPIMIGESATITVNASAAGRLDAWIDFNGDDDWAGPSEQVFASRDLVAGDNELSFSVPADASHGYSYARFRFSTAGGLSFDGPASDGEVEDYRVVVQRDWEPLHIDFNVDASSPTAAGYVGLLADELYSTETGFGWSGPDTPIGLATAGDSHPLLSDGHGAINGSTFLVDLPSGDYLVNVTLDRRTFAAAIVPEEGETVVFAPRGDNDHFSFPAHVDDDQLTLRWLGSIYGWSVDALDIYPAPIATHALSAAGNTFTGTGATPYVLVSVDTNVGVVLTPDVDPLYEGVQVRADETGTFQFTVQPQGLTGIVSVTSEEVNGAGSGALLDYTIPLTPLHIDFNVDASSPTAAGYVGLLADELYSTETGFGWSGPDTPIGLATAGDSHPLLSDGHGAINGSTFLVDLPSGDYLVNVTLDRRTFAAAIVPEEGETVVFALRGDNDHFSFPAHVDDDQLTLRWLGSIYGWSVDALDIYPAPIATHALSAAGNTFTGTGATPYVLVSVDTNVGVVLTPDVDPLYEGVQVRADETGTFQFTVQPQGLTGIVSVTSEEVNGAGSGALLDYTIPLTPLHIDFNVDASSPTAAGYVGLLADELYSTETGFGWSGPDTPIGLATAGDSHPLLSDGHGAINGSTFLVDLPSGDYLVNVTLDRRTFAAAIVPEEGETVVFAPRGDNDHFSFPAHVDDDQLTLRWLGSIYGWSVDALDIYPAPIATHALSAAGNTFTGTGATPYVLVSVDTNVGVVLTPDVDPLYEGVQVRADETGTFQFTVQPQGLTGIVSVTSEEVNGAGSGALLDYTIPLTPLHIDFNVDASSPTAAGYVGLLADELYSTETGFGWSGPDTPIGLATAGDSHPLLSDGHGAINGSTFLVDLPSGDYW